jgi:hypothetical protein
MVLGLELGKQQANGRTASLDEDADGVCTKTYNWICGFEDPGDQLVHMQEERSLMHHLDDVSSLEQTKLQKMVLNFFLVVILAVTVFLFLFFTVPSPVTNVPPPKVPEVWSTTVVTSTTGA